MIVFKKLRWKNLLSTGNVFTEVSLNTHNNTLIIGENGAGKSTILDALSFVLYGKPFRKVNKGQLLNSINEKQLVVELEFTVNNRNYFIRRGIKPNVFEIYSDGTLINPDANTGDYQEVLDKQILKINHKSFSQIVVLGSASFVPFMQLSAAHRREVIEDILDIQIFTVMNTLLKDKITKNKSDLLDIDHKISLTESTISLEVTHLSTLEQNNADMINEKQQQVTNYSNQVNTLSTTTNKLIAQTQQLLSTIQDHSKVSARQDRVRNLIRQLDARADKIRKDTTFFETNHDCPTCKQGIADNHKAAIVDAANTTLAEIDAGRNMLVQEDERLGSRLAEIQSIQASITTMQTSITSNQVEINTLNKFISGLEAEITKLNKAADLDVNKDRLKKLKEDLKNHTLEKANLINERAVHDAAAILLRDTGIKTKIIRQYIPIINKLINKYLASMDFFVNFELDENFEETIKSRFRDEFSYASFSEGEKSRIDLALLFTWRAISKLRNSANTNLLLLDEVFDGSLDSQGNEELLKIIQSFTEGSNVFVISHKTDAYLDKFERILKFEKQKNFSVMSVL